MLRRVVQHVSVQEALLDPREDPVPYFCEAIATSILGDDKDMDQMRAESALCDILVDERDAPRPEPIIISDSEYPSRRGDDDDDGESNSSLTHSAPPPLPAAANAVNINGAYSRLVPKAAELVPGDVQCIVEEVLEDVLFGLVAAALAEEGVVVSAVAEKTRAMTLRRETL
eukprot:TRINITY_DN9092_c0_g1_i1.p1 TRINITY_DN9092_c0_g1~~TRINITY_DN9092_c0_g1_i1.p1  ORF type:complete len:171 (-),score=35.29 TRINITY_DN9092_c0_g1_i1:242-754(-)